VCLVWPNFAAGSLGKITFGLEKLEPRTCPVLAFSVLDDEGFHAL